MPELSTLGSDILATVKTVDGAGSGLDADTLDGLSSAAFATAAQGAKADTAVQPADLADFGGGDMLAATYDPQAIADDAFDRANHTGEQAISTVTNLQTSLDAKAAVLTLTPDATAGGRGRVPWRRFADGPGEATSIIPVHAFNSSTGGAHFGWRGTAGPTSSSGALTFNLTMNDGANAFAVTKLTENITSMTFSNLQSATGFNQLLIKFTQGASAYTVTWPAAVKSATGEQFAPTISSTEDDVHYFWLVTIDGGTTWIATELGNASAGALQPGDIASGTITARDDDLDLSGGSDGHVLTVQADGSAAFEAPAAATVTVDQYDVVLRIAAGTGAASGQAAADLTEDTEAASGFLFLGWETGGALRTVDVDTLRAEVTDTAVGMVPAYPSNIQHVFRGDGTWGAPVGVDGLTTSIDSATTLTIDDALDAVHKRLSATDPVAVTLAADGSVGTFCAITPGDGAVTVTVEGGAGYRLPPGDTPADAVRTSSFVLKGYVEFECIANSDDVSAEWDVWGTIDGAETIVYGPLNANGQELTGVKVPTGTVSGTLTMVDHSTGAFVTSGNVTIPNEAGFAVTLKAGGAHDVDAGGAALTLATGDWLSVIVWAEDDIEYVHQIAAAVGSLATS